MLCNAPDGLSLDVQHRDWASSAKRTAWAFSAKRTAGSLTDTEVSRVRTVGTRNHGVMTFGSHGTSGHVRDRGSCTSRTHRGAESGCPSAFGHDGNFRSCI